MDYRLDPPDYIPCCYCGNDAVSFEGRRPTFDEDDGPIICHDCASHCCDECGTGQEDAPILLCDSVAENKLCPDCWAAEYFNMPPEDQPTADETTSIRWEH